MEPKKQPTTIKFELDDTAYETHSTPKHANRKPYAPANPDQIKAFLPGVIAALKVAAGQVVKQGEQLLTLEAMKMQNAVFAPRDGIIKAVHVAAGDMVPKGRVLLEYQQDQ